ETTEWDLGAVYYDAIDHVGHLFMKYHPPQMPTVSDEDFARYRHAVTAGYRLHDMLLDQLLTLAGPDTTVVLVSDHGFHSDHLRPLAIPAIPAGPAVEHRAFGVFAAAGPGVAPGTRVHGATLLDVAPTVLALLGLPAGEDMPGRVLAEAFEAAPTVGRVPTWEPEGGQDRPAPGSVDDEEEAAAAEQEAVRQLAALGYVDGDATDGLAVQADRDARYYLSKVLLSLGRASEAVALLEALYAEAEPQLYGPWLAYALLQDGRPADAERVADAVEALVGAAIPMLGLFRAEAALQRGRPADAVAGLNALAAEEPGNPEFHLGRARALASAGRPAEAEAAAEATLALDPENARAHGLLADLRLGRGDVEGAAEAALEAVGRLYTFPNAHLTLGRAFAALGAPDRAAQAFLVAAAQAPRAAVPHRELARLYREAGEPALSAHHHALALSLDAEAAAHQAFGTAPPPAR
ncbi:MAG TPA: tetratricopeptide repeat protein, partial [Rubricoccaceae bacterium]